MAVNRKDNQPKVSPRVVKDNLTRGNIKFIEAKLEGKNQTDAARLAGYSFPRQSGYDLMEQPKIQSALLTRMEDAGIDDNFIAKGLKEGCKALAPPRKDGGEQYADYFTRKQYLDIILRVRGDFAPETHQHISKNITVVIDHNMLKALKDAGGLDEKEAEVIEHEPIREENGKDNK